MSDCKSVLVKNNTNDNDGILYLYSIHDPLCWISSSSKIVKPGHSYLYRSVNKFRFEIQVKNQKSKTTVVDVRKWEKDLNFTIFDINDVKESDLEDHDLDKTICIRKLNIEKDGEIDGGRNLYEILNLNFKEIRKLKREDQDQKIKQAFRQEILRWHIDKAGKHGDHKMAREVILAYDVLRNREKRADYHNKVNYSEGWLSTSRWKSIFATECETYEQKLRYKKRMGMMALSLGISVGGLALSVFTAGTVVPVIAICGPLGAGFLGGGIQSFFRTINQNSVEKGCDWGDYGKSFGFGFIGGAIAGGAGVGIAAGIAGISSAATLASASTMGQSIGIGASSAAVAGVALSLAADAERKFVDKVDVTWKQVVGHAVVGAVIGALSGTAVGAVAGALAGMSAEVSSTNIERKVLLGIKRYRVSISKCLAKGATNKSTESVLGSLTGFIEEHMDDDRENRPISEHIKESGTNIVVSVFKDAASGVISTTAEHFGNEIKVHLKAVASNDGDNGGSSANAESSDGTVNVPHVGEAENSDSIKNNTESKQHKRQRIRCEIDKKSRLTWIETTVKAKYNQLADDCFSNKCDLDIDDIIVEEYSDESDLDIDDILFEEYNDESDLDDLIVEVDSDESRSNFDSDDIGYSNDWCEDDGITDSSGDVNFDANSVEGDSDTEISDSEDCVCIKAETNARFKYISEGLWKSKMIVEYRYNNKPMQTETSGSGTAIEIPIDAEDVKVYFKVMRFISTWCDLKKWDRFEKQWFDEPHIFTYKCPPEQRTFTLSGSLYFEGVTHISNEMHDDVNEI
ncbi:Hypothetical predicted protein [Mytilus galloprovincialis]|uniref:J domain-containing protein n=2 Tax=Mytilus galloprovincialis TaxID=29158 RepID=A0A8B6EBQ2_MYTGA|nr:Hypothetical predicted protein [Mytilus galloprovincialis]